MLRPRKMCGLSKNQKMKILSKKENDLQRMKNENGKWKIEMSTKKTKKAALSLMIRVLITLVLRLLS